MIGPDDFLVTGCLEQILKWTLFAPGRLVSFLVRRGELPARVTLDVVVVSVLFWGALVAVALQAEWIELR